MASVTERNYALDYFRAIALGMMVLAHFMYFFMSYELGSMDRFIRDVMEAAPAIFFIAFGMTMMHNASRPSRWRSFFELGLISVFHQIYLCKTDVELPNFLLFLWFMYFIILALRPLFADKWIRVIIALAILVVNFFIGHQEFGYIGEHPFGIMPWAFYVMIGISLGIRKPENKGLLRILIAGIAMIGIAFVIPAVSPHLGVSLLRGGITKWQPTTSAYLLLTSGISLLIYWALNLIKFNQSNRFNTVAIFTSKFLLLGTVAHYLTNRFIRILVQQSGYSGDMEFPVLLILVTSVMLLGGLYGVMILLADSRSVILKRWVDEKTFYLFAWIAALSLLLITIPMFIEYGNTTLVQFLSWLGMTVIAWGAMRLKKGDIAQG